jgi:hypothetical protein
MNACVPPLLLGSAGSVTRTPCGHSAIVGFTEESDRHTRRRRLGLEAVCFWKAALPFSRVTGPTGLDATIRAETSIGGRILPSLGAKFTDLSRPLLLPRFAEPRVVLGWPKAHPYCVRANL